MNRLFPLIPAVLLLAACGAEQPTDDDRPSGKPQVDAMTEHEIEPGLEDEIRQARQELARTMKLSQEAMRVVGAEFVTWPSSALGCPEEGMMYTQALVPGYRIVLATGDDVHHFHGARGKAPFPCPKDRLQQPAGTGKGKPDPR